MMLATRVAGSIPAALLRRQTPAACAAARCALSTAAPEGEEIDSMWMPFTYQRQFRDAPRLLAEAEPNSVYYKTPEGNRVLDGCAALWCSNAGHNRTRIVEAVQAQAAKMDFAPSFNMGHPLAFEFADRVLETIPDRGFGQVFFTMCGSSAVDSSMKLALAYHRARGEGSRTKFIGRERGYHGVGFGGISVGGISPNRKTFGGCLLPSDHITHTHTNLEEQAFSRGQPEWGAHLADDLERVIQLHDASNIAGVYIEPVAGSTGVLPPPVGYLERVRAICDKYDVPLIFDEVIAGWGRVGHAFAAQRFDVTPDMITTAKGLTNAAVPCGAVLVQQDIFDTVFNAADAAGPTSNIEFFHGYTYSAHPLSMAAGLATLDVYEEEGLFERSRNLEQYFEDAIHSVRDSAKNIRDIRNIGLMGAIELEPHPEHPTRRAFEAFIKLFENGLLTRCTGNTLAFSPPLIIEKEQIDEIFSKVSDVLKTID